LKASDNLDTIDVFLSYNSKDRVLAGRIKENLEQFGISVFLAHSDMEGGERWEREIIHRIRICDVVLVLLTPRFRRSKWTDHEVGMGIGGSKEIIPLRVTGVKLYGFLSRYHALKLEPSALSQACNGIILAMRSKTKLRQRLQNSFIQSFATTRSFIEANRKSELLDEFGPYSSKQVSSILQAYMQNVQIHRPTTAGSRFRDFLRKNRKLIRATEGIPESAKTRTTRLAPSELEQLLSKVGKP